MAGNIHENDGIALLLSKINSGQLARELVNGANIILARLNTPDDIAHEINRITLKEQKREDLSGGEILFMSSFKVEARLMRAQYLANKPELSLPGVDWNDVFGDEGREQLANRTIENAYSIVASLSAAWEIGKKD